MATHTHTHTSSAEGRRHKPRERPANGQRALLPGVPTYWRCRACGRQLVSAASIARGLGRACARKVKEPAADE